MHASALAFVSCDTPPDRLSPRDVGGKAWSLLRLRASGFNVPRFLIVPTWVFEEVHCNAREAIEAALSRLDPADPTALSSVSRRIAEALGRGALPSSFEDELSRRLTGTFGAERLIAVRSSAVGEDSAEQSFAGILDSVLNVRPEQAVPAIRRVWASAFSERALLYRCRRGLSLAGICTAVVLQEMVVSAASGVLFTRDPGDGSARCVITAGLGLGEGVVSDAVETDTYRIPWDSRRVDREVRRKDVRVVLDRESGCGTRLEPVPPGLQARAALCEAQVRQLRDAGVEAERRFGRPQDIEWAFDERGRLFILQARPIVGPMASAGGLRRIWDNSNIVESYPGLTLPLTFTFVRSAYEQIFRRSSLGFVPFANPMRDRLHIFKSMVGLLEGRVYYNLLNWYEMLAHLPAPERQREVWDRLIGVTEQTARPSARGNALGRVVALVSAASILASVRLIGRRFFRSFDAFYARYQDAGARKAPADETVETYRALERDVTRFWHLTLWNDFCAMAYHETLGVLCRRWIPGHPGLQNGLLCGDQGFDSVAPVRSLVGLAETVRREPLYRGLFARSSDGEVWDAIHRDAELWGLKGALDRHLAAFGDRGLEDLKLETPTFREEPARLVGLIRRYAELGLSVKAVEEQEARIRCEAEASLSSHLRHPLKRWALRFVLRRARLAIRNRESMRLARSRLFGIVRRLFRRLGVVFAEAGLLEAAADVLYLALDEVLGVVEGTAVTWDLKGLVQIRKQEYATFTRREPGERLETVGIPCLDTLEGADVVAGGGTSLKGVGCSAGRASGRAQVVGDPRSVAGGSGRILVAKSTDPGWVFLMISSGGIVVEKGSLLSHTAIIGRELGIPTVVGVKGATRLIPDGAAIAIDGTTGEVRWQ